MPKKIVKKVIEKAVNFEYTIVIPEDEVKSAVERGLLDAMLETYFKVARFDILALIEKKYV